MVGVYIIQGDLLAGLNISKCKKDEMAVNDSRETVWRAGVVDKLGAVASSASVDTPVRIDPADVDSAFPTHSAGDLAAGNPLTGILRDLLPLAKTGRGKASLAVDLRFPDGDAGREIGFHRADQTWKLSIAACSLSNRSKT